MVMANPAPGENVVAGSAIQRVLDNDLVNEDVGFGGD